MPTLVKATSKCAPMVGMGQIMLVRSPEILTSILGSCIGVALHHAATRTGVFAHVVLPERSGRPGPDGKFADSVVPAMLKMLVEANVPPMNLTARIAGGASMFASSGPLQVGESNVAAVTTALEKAKIMIVGSHVGGVKGRRVEFRPEQAQLVVEVMGQPPVTL